MGNNIGSKLGAGKGDIIYSEILIKGTNISIREVLRQLSLGKSFEEVLNAFPEMTIDDLHTCFEYAFELVAAFDLKKSMTAINRVIEKRNAVVKNLDKLIVDLELNPDKHLKYFSSDKSDNSSED